MKTGTLNHDTYICYQKKKTEQFELLKNEITKDSDYKYNGKIFPQITHLPHR